MEDGELRGLLEQIQEDVRKAMEATEEVGRSLTEHRLTTANVVGDLKMSLSGLSANIGVLVAAVKDSVEEGRETTGGVKELVSEMKQERSVREWEQARRAHGGSKGGSSKAIVELSLKIAAGAIGLGALIALGAERGWPILRAMFGLP